MQALIADFLAARVDALGGLPMLKQLRGHRTIFIGIWVVFCNATEMICDRIDQVQRLTDLKASTDKTFGESVDLHGPVWEIGIELTL